MPSPIPQYRIWNSTKALKRKFLCHEAVALYRSVEADMRNIQEWRADRKEEDNLFDQALFFSDFFGALADAGIYTEAEEMGRFAIKLIEENGFHTLKYAYYNMGNVYLFQKEYARSIEWYQAALSGRPLLYRSANSYLVNYGIALYHLEKTDEAKESFLTAIKYSKGTKYDKNFEPFFFMEKISRLQDENKQIPKYRKMYLTRLKKYSRAEIEWEVSVIEYGAEILADYETQEESK